MLKFFLGTAAGAILAFAFVRFNVALPAVVELPDRVRGNVVATVVEDDLYDLDQDEAARTRALQVYFTNRAEDAAKLDAATGHPFLNALHHRRAGREARELAAQWTAYDKVLEKPALRAALERKHALSDTEDLKRAMLFAALARKPFLKRWLIRQGTPATAETLRDRLSATAVEARDD